jgi:hypothetical protein|uniref:Uncharacterized protein n=1 Tax=Ackermannviridae sp. TaxID=2831612 RepID=A0A8S5VU38_9CAUD|nr:MAG TPA: hypothetical protein [Ackermannviridae sp.]
MEENNSKAWDIYSTLEVDENGIPITTPSESVREVINEEPRQTIMLHRNEIEEEDNSQKIVYESGDESHAIKLPPRKLNLPNEVIGIVKNGVKSTISFNIMVEIDMIPESIIDFLSESYNIPKEDVVKDIVELSFDEDDAKKILSEGIIKELWKEEK